jgi:hypothetical protein
MMRIDIACGNCHEVPARFAGWHGGLADLADGVGRMGTVTGAKDTFSARSPLNVSSTSFVDFCLVVTASAGTRGAWSTFSATGISSPWLGRPLQPAHSITSIAAIAKTGDAGHSRIVLSGNIFSKLNRRIPSCGTKSAFVFGRNRRQSGRDVDIAKRRR